MFINARVFDIAVLKFLLLGKHNVPSYVLSTLEKANVDKTYMCSEAFH